MNLESLPAIITLLIALSMATERAVEIVKSTIPWLDLVKQDAVMEGRRRAAVQLLAVVFGIVITYFTWPVVAQVVAETAAKDRKESLVMAFGLLSSGGSAFWNSLLGIVLNLKVAKGAEAKLKQDTARAGTTVIPHPDEGQLP